MKRLTVTVLFFTITCFAWAQATFKAGWNTCKTGVIIHEYIYNYTNDTTKISLVDSSQVFVATDSLTTLTLHYPFRDKSVYKTVNYFTPRKQIARTEEYKDDNLTMTYEWRYDDKNRKVYYYEENKATGNNFRKTYEYASDKKNGDNICTESSYYNGRIEFYTKTYCNKENVKYKEIRLNDNNKDVVHVESFYYGDNGKLKERSIYFPEWRVTKKFQEKDGNMLSKCSRCMPVGTAEKITIAGKLPFIKRLIGRNQALLSDPDCTQFEYIFKNFTNCEIVITTTNVNKVKNVVFRYKEKVL